MCVCTCTVVYHSFDCVARRTVWSVWSSNCKPTDNLWPNRPRKQRNWRKSWRSSLEDTRWRYSQGLIWGGGGAGGQMPPPKQMTLLQNIVTYKYCYMYNYTCLSCLCQTCSPPQVSTIINFAPQGHKLLNPDSHWFVDSLPPFSSSLLFSLPTFLSFPPSLHHSLGSCQFPVTAGSWGPWSVGAKPCRAADIQETAGDGGSGHPTQTRSMYVYTMLSTYLRWSSRSWIWEP